MGRGRLGPRGAPRAACARSTGVPDPARGKDRRCRYRTWPGWRPGQAPPGASHSPARARRKWSMECMSEATVAALPGRRPPWFGRKESDPGFGGTDLVYPVTVDHLPHVLVGFHGRPAPLADLAGGVGLVPFCVKVQELLFRQFATQPSRELAAREPGARSPSTARPSSRFSRPSTTSPSPYSGVKDMVPLFMVRISWVEPSRKLPPESDYRSTSAAFWQEGGIPGPWPRRCDRTA